MPTETNREAQLQQVIEWARRNEDIRVTLLTSSLVNPYAPVDEFSDLDIEFVVADLKPFLADDTWISHFGNIVAMVAENEEAFDGKHAMRMVFYEDYSKIDFKLYSVAEFIKDVTAAELPEDWDVGYRVLLDKDGLTRSMKAPTYQSVFIQQPDQATYCRIINDCWWDMTYVAKCLSREDLFYAKFMSEDNMRTQYLQRIIEWHIGLQHDWKVTTNKHGRLFKQFLSPGMWRKIEATFSGSNIEDNWNALFAYTVLVRELGMEIGAALQYPYPSTLDEKICAYLQYVRSIGKSHP